jgi:hypothetical protein
MEIWNEPMDPSDVLDFTVDCTALLATGENIISYTVAPGAESTLIGLTVSNTSVAANIITLWISFTNPTDVAFNNLVTLPVEVTINTNFSRKFQRTVKVQVTQR